MVNQKASSVLFWGAQPQDEEFFRANCAGRSRSEVLSSLKAIQNSLGKLSWASQWGAPGRKLCRRSACWAARGFQLQMDVELKSFGL